MFKVKKERCNQCLFSPEKIVSNERRRQILTDCKANDAHFDCHKEKDVCCRGFYETNSTNLMRIAQRMGMIQEVS